MKKYIVFISVVIMIFISPINVMCEQKIINSTRVILDKKNEDVTGDGFSDYIFLTGVKPFSDDSPFRDEIQLVVVDGVNKSVTTIELEENAGYNPSLFIGDFTNDAIQDVFVSIDTGGSGGYAYYYIYTFINNEPNLVFDFQNFNDKYKYKVNYLDDYKVEVISIATNTKYIIDISNRDKEYLSQIYNELGQLIKPNTGWVNALGGLYPIDFLNDGNYELYAVQKIVGLYNADALGYVQTSLKWEDYEFKHFFQTVGILGVK